MKFSIVRNRVYVDDRETQILSGAIHYFRTLPEQWEDRLRKLKACGFNTVETYLAWHLHETREGEFDFSGRLDVGKFIELAGQLGLMVIVRPGPYICSECDLGGLPGWLLGKDGIRLRCQNSVFLRYTERFYHEAMIRLVPLQCTCGGPLIAMQVENEYGSYCSDKTYLRTLRDRIRRDGIDIQLFTSDGPGEAWLTAGTLPDLPATVNHRNHPLSTYASLDACDTGYANAHFTMELWVGKAWHWGVPPQHHPDAAVAQDFREIVEDKASVNCYMFHGGTNFGFTSGANDFGNGYLPLLTSYEVDALLDEGGRPTSKYYAVQQVLEEFRPGSTAPVSPSPSTACEPVEITGYVSLRDSLDTLSTPVSLPLPEPMEHFGQSFGFILYTTEINRCQSGNYVLQNMRDRAIVMLDGKTVAVVYRNDPLKQVEISASRDGMRLDILVENMGRVCFGTTMESERRGMTGFHCGGNIRHLSGWTVRPLPLDDWSSLRFGTAFPETSEPGFYRAVLTLQETPRDTYLKFPSGVRGCVQVNGFNLGRYWTVGPQRTLYLPAPLLKRGENEIVVFELHGLTSRKLEFSSERILDPRSDMCLP